jgi:hypothetical protein
VERRFEFRHVILRIQGALVNAYDRANLFDFDLATGQRIDQLPLIPSLGVNVEVR